MRTFLSLLVLTMLVATLAPIAHAQEGDLLIGVTYSPFTSRDWDVATLKPDGTGMNTIIDNGGYSHGMRWSPDRSHIAFKADITATEFEIFVADSSGGNVLQLTDWNPTYNQGQPVWLNDSMIVFASWDYANATTDVYQMKIDGTETTQLAATAGYLAPHSIHGTLLAFSHRMSENDIHPEEIFTAELSTLGDQATWNQLTDNGVNDNQPRFSSDGSMIAFIRSDDASDYWGYPFNIWTMSVDGSNQSQLTFSNDRNNVNIHPVWSPDDESIAYMNYHPAKGVEGDIMIVPAVGGISDNITNTPDLSEAVHDWRTVPTATGELLFPTVVVKPCDEIDQGCVAQPVMTSASAPLNGATIPVAIPEGMEVCSVSTYGCITETWDYTYIFDYSVDSGFVFVSLANSLGEMLPADTATVFNIYYHAARLCNEDVVYHFDTTLYDDVSRQLLFSDEDHAMVRPEFDKMVDSAVVAGYRPGDLNDDEVVNIMDLTLMVCYMFQDCGSLCILNTADINGDCCGPNIADMTYLIDYLFGTGDAPLCGCLEQGCPVMKAAFAANAWAEFDGSQTVIHVNTAQMLRGLELTLVGEGSADPQSMLDDGIEVLHGYQGGNLLRVGLVDLQGAHFIQSGSQAVISVAGEFRIAEVYGSDMDHRGVPMATPLSAPVVPQSFVLHQNYPNPFNPATTISFESPEAADYTLTVYNTLGQVVKRFEGTAQPGENEVIWDASSSSSGVYFYKLEIGNNTDTRKMMLLK